MNKAPSLPLTVGLMGGCRVAGFQVLLQVVWGGVVAEIGNAAVLGK